jgi:uncharacterized membrane protein YccC
MWFLSLFERPAVEHSARTAVAAIASLLVARVFKLPEAYWAAISTLIVMQSSFGAALKVSVRRFAGTALGAAVGALLATHWGTNVLAFGAGIFLTGLICLALGRAQRFNEYLDRTTYRYAGVALAITMLVVRYNAPWVVAVHRFLEVSIGIAVGLALTVLWPERQPQEAAPRAK